jgi:wyosine [tRNA(Phe)-imidazoG37] synthetase (radical SAM superfamily)
LRSDLARLGPIECDQVTFAGLGEPTLARNLPELADVARAHVDCSVAVLTGSALMPRADVRRDLLCFDHVVIKLDAPNRALFDRINRPGSGYPYSWRPLVDGIRAFCQTFTGHISLQTMFVQANASSASQMAEMARSLQVHELHLDTPLQPALGNPVSPSQMAQVMRAFSDLPPGIEIKSIYRAEQARITPRAL